MTDRDKITNVLDILGDIFNKPMYKLDGRNIVCEDKTFVCNMAGEIIKIREA